MYRLKFPLRFYFCIPSNYVFILFIQKGKYLENLWYACACVRMGKINVSKASKILRTYFTQNILFLIAYFTSKIRNGNFLELSLLQVDKVESFLTLKLFYIALCTPRQ